MKQLIYVSRPANEIEPHTVRDILTISYKMNSENNISGMLICDGEYFLQCIEGDEEAIDQLYSNICKDIRHFDIKLIGKIDIDQRDFQEWDMGYISSRKDIIDTIDELTSDNDFTPYQFTFREAKSMLQRLTSLL